jgi:Fe2+ transport system protein FeoA
LANDLFSLPVGKVAVVTSIQPASLVSFGRIGLRVGTKVMAVAKTAGPGLIVRIGDARVCVGRKMAREVEISIKEQRA